MAHWGLSRQKQTNFIGGAIIVFRYKQPNKANEIPMRLLTLFHKKSTIL
jgi:hypothetical protein